MVSWLQKSVFSVSRRTTAITWNTNLLQTNHILYWNSSQIIQLWCYLFSEIWYPSVFISVSVKTNLYRDNIHNMYVNYKTRFFNVLLTVHTCTILQTNPKRCTILLSIFISLLYMFPATTCPSSGEITVSMRHWYLSLCMSGVWSAGWSFIPTSRPDPTHTVTNTSVA
jgi:hypothetical protein